MNTFNELHAEWLKDLSREDRAEARKAVAAGRAIAIPRSGPAPRSAAS